VKKRHREGKKTFERKIVRHNEEIAHNKTISGTKITELKHLDQSLNKLKCKCENLAERDELWQV
jgi:hypothetical protein